MDNEKWIMNREILTTVFHFLEITGFRQVHRSFSTNLHFLLSILNCQLPTFNYSGQGKIPEKENANGRIRRIKKKRPAGGPGPLAEVRFSPKGGCV
jgi:hypothetical protein